jgi:hypothetical protein
MRTSAKLLLALSLMAAPTLAKACAVMIPPGERVETARAKGTIVAVAIVQVTGATYRKQPVHDLRPWRAKASLTQVLQGDAPPATVEFERGWGSAACEWSAPPLPRSGDRWVVYFWRDRVSGLRPWLAMPLAEAKTLDAGLFKRNP